jgi:hypothetical protein
LVVVGVRVVGEFVCERGEIKFERWGKSMWNEVALGLIYPRREFQR